MFYSWQNEAVRAIEDRSAILSAPTGSGKTWVAYRWAGLMDEKGEMRPPEGRVIFTAPIKALSNERYLDLRAKGFDVGLETGDFKKNAEARILCCTQEIYTLKYARRGTQKVVVDEFHYIFNDPDRTRAYIDGIRATPQDSDLLVMSATFGNPEKVHRYLEEVARREFALYKTDQRVTKLVFKRRGVRFSGIHDALVFVFSRKGAEYLAHQIAATRKKLGEKNRLRLLEMAEILEVKRIPETMFYGVGIYHGSLFPKEKLLVEMAFRERLLDVVVGTDALSLGVNLPAETVIFGQLAKFIDGPLSRNEFLQMAGRAGRKGFYETGFVTYLPRSRCEHFDYDTETLYYQLLDAPSEPARILLQPAVGRLLKREAPPEEEARLISEYSLPQREYAVVLAEIESLLRKIGKALREVRPPKERRRLKAILADLWFDEMSVESNVAVAKLFLREDRPHALRVADILRKEERNYLQALLKVKRYANRMPEGYSFSHLEEIDRTVEAIDATVFAFEEKITEITESDAWTFSQALQVGLERK